MTNYYEEFAEIDQHDSSAEIMKKLIQLEVIWNKRVSAQPEKAAAKLVIITEAKKVFASENSKKKYDQALFAAPADEKKEDLNAVRKAQFDRWYMDAQRYVNNGQNDLAKTALENALGYAAEESKDPWFNYLASEIYRVNGDVSSAISHVNQAIVMEPDNAAFYLEKGRVYEVQYLQARNNRMGDAVSILYQQRETLKQAANLASISGDNRLRGIILGVWAHSLYNFNPTDAIRGEQLAKEAVSLGDEWGNAQRVLSSIETERENARRAEEERKARAERAAREEKARKAERERQERIAREERERRAREEQARKAREKRLEAIRILILIISPIGMIATITFCYTTRYSVNGPHLGFEILLIMAMLSLAGFNYASEPYGVFDVEDWVRPIGIIFGLWVIWALIPVYAREIPFVEALKPMGLMALALIVSALIGRILYLAVMKKR